MKGRAAVASVIQLLPRGNDAATHAEREGSLRRNSLWLMTTTIVNSALGYGYWLIVARLFSPTTVGLAAGLIALMTITSLASNLGTPSSLVARLPTRKNAEDWSRSLSASLIGGAAFGIVAAAIVLIGFAGVSPVVPTARSSVLLTLLFVVGCASWTASTVLDYTFIALRRSSAMTARNTLFGLAKIPLVLLGVAVAQAQGGATIVFASWVLACCVSCAVSLCFTLRRLYPTARLRLVGTLSELIGFRRVLLSNHLITLGNVLPAYVLPLIVVSRLSTRANAFFYITWLVGGVFFTVSSSIASSLFAEGSNSPLALQRLSSRSMRLTTKLLLPAMIAMALLGRYVLGVFGPQYAKAGIGLLLVLTVAAIPDAITNIQVAVLRVERRLRAAAILTCSMALLALIGGWALAPEGITAIGLVWLAAQSLGSAWVAWDRWRRARQEAVA